MSDEKENKQPESEAPEAAAAPEEAAKKAEAPKADSTEEASKADSSKDGDAKEAKSDSGKSDSEKPKGRSSEPPRVRGRPSQQGRGGRGQGGGGRGGKDGGGRGGRDGGKDGGGRGGRGGKRGDRDADAQSSEAPLEERVLKINRCATVVKGGRRFSFSALVIVGDRKGRVGVGFGKANEVPPTVEKAVKDAKKSFFNVPIANGTIPHEVVGVYRGSRVVLLPAQPGTGIIAGAVVRAMAECSGIQNILTKSFGSNNPINLAKAAASALQQLRSREEVMRLRGVTL